PSRLDSNVWMLLKLSSRFIQSSMLKLLPWLKVSPSITQSFTPSKSIKLPQSGNATWNVALSSPHGEALSIVHVISYVTPLAPVKVALGALIFENTKGLPAGTETADQVPAPFPTKFI